MKILFVILILFLSANTYSQSLTGEDELFNQYKIVDKELNNVYNSLIKKLNKVGRNNLVKAQNAWITFRDSDCKFKSKEDSEGGVIANKMKIDCLIDLTNERKNELNELLKEF
jgi:uncharacterized protein YecT (DUF1311 family)